MDLLWQYVLVFLTAAVPMLEVMIVIPASVAAGMHPVPVGLLAFAGNATTLVLAVVAGDEVIGRMRREPRGDAPPSRRRERVRRIAYRWGLPGVALLGPLTVGSHTAALAAVALRMPRGLVLAWSLAGVAAWSIVFAVLSAFGRAVI
ncbi:MAG: small multi-drug export protein [Acidimicrobiales bacterium]|nr:small multi-drug export protein [Acidimicrobiales bacterium]